MGESIAAQLTKTMANHDFQKEMPGMANTFHHGQPSQKYLASTHFDLVILRHGVSMIVIQKEKQK